MWCAHCQANSSADRQLGTARDAAPEMLSDWRFFAPWYVKLDRAFLRHPAAKSDCGGKHRAALTSQNETNIWATTFSPLFFFPRLPPFCHPQPLFLCHFVRFLGSATSFSLSLGCSSVVAYTRFPVMFSLPSSASPRLSNCTSSYKAN